MWSVRASSRGSARGVRRYRAIHATRGAEVPHPRRGTGGAGPWVGGTVAGGRADGTAARPAPHSQGNAALAGARRTSGARVAVSGSPRDVLLTLGRRGIHSTVIPLPVRCASPVAESGPFATLRCH